MVRYMVDDLFGSIFTFIIIFAVIMSLVFIIGTIVLFRYMIKNLKSNKKNGKKVLATIKSIERVNQRDNDGNIYNSELVIMCNFEYEGSHELRLFYNYKLDIEKLKPGDRIECIYDPEHDYLTTKENIISGFVWIGFCIGFVLFIFAIDFVKEKVIEKNIYNLSNDTISTISFIGELTILIIAFIVWEFFAIRMYDKYWQEGKYIKLKGKVVDIHKRYDSGIDSPGVYLYAPEIVFKYNGEKERIISSRWSSSKKYINGQDVDIFYNPEEKTIYEKGNNTFAIIMIILGLLWLIPVIQMFTK